MSRRRTKIMTSRAIKENNQGIPTNFPEIKLRVHYQVPINQKSRVQHIHQIHTSTTYVCVSIGEGERQ